MICWLLDPICESVYINMYNCVCVCYSAIMTCSAPVFCLTYSCTYWFVKQPIKLDMEFGMSWLATVNQRNGFMAAKYFLWFFIDFSKGTFGLFFFLLSLNQEEPVDTCVTLCVKLWLCLCLAVCGLWWRLVDNKEIWRLLFHGSELDKIGC